MQEIRQSYTIQFFAFVTQDRKWNSGPTFSTKYKAIISLQLDASKIIHKNTIMF